MSIVSVAGNAGGYVTQSYFGGDQPPRFAYEARSYHIDRPNTATLPWMGLSEEASVREAKMHVVPRSINNHSSEPYGWGRRYHQPELDATVESRIEREAWTRFPRDRRFNSVFVQASQNLLTK